MHRDWNIIRSILLEVEFADPGSMVSVLHIANSKMFSMQSGAYDEDAVREHISMLETSGLVTGPTHIHRPEGITHILWTLTWRGQELVEIIRDIGRWNRICQYAPMHGRGGGPALTEELIFYISQLLLKRELHA